MNTKLRNWLVGYDIADKRRLNRVHRFLKGRAIPVQYSVFVFRGSQTALQVVLGGISELISTNEDDVRAYHLPDRCEVAMLGCQDLPEGVFLGGHGLDRLLQEIGISEESPTLDIYIDDHEPLSESCYLL
jgi:CRISPR-associated protein Cas2